MRTVIEGQLPAQFLLDLGTYMQTAAHIELAVWQIIMLAEGVDPRTPEARRGHIFLKLDTREILKCFRESATHCPPWIAERIDAIADRVKEGLETRNLAAHGAFFDSKGDGTISTVHYFARGRGKSRQPFEVQQTVTRQMVEDTLKVADQLLRDVSALYSTVERWRYPEGVPQAKPAQIVITESGVTIEPG